MANRIFRPLVEWVVRYRQQIIQFGWPLMLFESFNWSYDHFFFPFAIGIWGAFWGGVIPVAGAFAINAIAFWAYDHMKIDWLKAKLAASYADEENKTKFQKFTTWHRQKRPGWRGKLQGISVFIGLTAVIDPVILSIYYRESYFKGVSARDWFVLLAATVSACFLWLLGWEVGIFVVKFVYHFIHTTFFH